MAIIYGVARSTSGVVVPTPTITIYDGGTTTVSTIYSDDDLTTATANPFTGAVDGTYSCFVPSGLYDIKIVKSGYVDDSISNFPVSGPDRNSNKPVFYYTGQGTGDLFGVYQMPVLSPGSTYFGIQVWRIWIIKDANSQAEVFAPIIKCYNSSDVLQWTVDPADTAITFARPGVGALVYPDADGIPLMTTQVTNLNIDIVTETVARPMASSDVLTFTVGTAMTDVHFALQMLVLEY